MYVHSDTLLKLKCADCKLYLSQFPIYSNQSGQSFCGRCHVNPLDSFRNELYEGIAEKQKFPCRYELDGCLEKAVPVDIPSHEEHCPFKKHNCPMLLNPNCQWTGYSRNLLEHFEQCHPTFLLTEGDFEIDFINTHRENYLFPYGEELYIVFRATESQFGTFVCSIRSIGTNPSTADYMFEMTLKSNNQSQHVLTEKLNGRIEISSEELKQILKDPVSIVARIDIIRSAEHTEDSTEEFQHKDLNYDLLRDLECMYCMEYMVPPIYQCVTGHSICNICKSQVSECPTCRQEIKDTLNFSLARIIQYIEYPCKHSKCRYKAKAKYIKQHEATCIYGEYVCPLKDNGGCSSFMMYSDMYEHIRKNHYENLAEMEIITLPFCKSYKNCYIIRYGSKLFRLHFSYDEKNLKWSMQLIGPANEAANYKYEIDIIDPKGGSLRFYFKMSCSPLNNEPFDSDSSNYNFISRDQIKDMVGTELSYRVRISEQ